MVLHDNMKMPRNSSMILALFVATIDQFLEILLFIRHSVPD